MHRHERPWRSLEDPQQRRRLQGSRVACFARSLGCVKELDSLLAAASSSDGTSSVFVAVRTTIAHLSKKLCYTRLYCTILVPRTHQERDLAGQVASQENGTGRLEGQIRIETCRVRVVLGVSHLSGMSR